MIFLKRMIVNSLVIRNIYLVSQLSNNVQIFLPGTGCDKSWEDIHIVDFGHMIACVEYKLTKFMGAIQ